MSNVTIRPATLEDSETLLSWANEADSLAWKQNTQSVISSADHNEWLQARLSDKETALWIIMAADRPVGQLRLEKKKDSVHTDIYLTQDSRGNGYAAAALEAAINEYCKAFGPQQFLAVIHRDNRASQSLFSRLFFSPVEHDDRNWLLFIKPAE